MRRNILCFALAALIVPWLASAASAAMVTGKITRIDSSAKTFSVQNGKSDMSFALGSTAKVMEGTKAITLGTLRVGDSVKVDYSDQAGKHTATGVWKQASAAKAKAAVPHKEAPAKPGSSAN